ncbi:S-layer homology domain-containing protein [Bacillus tuaregi]|uniref:S-layer homology domain-containing protein n=1 Tax=Bacillus tuaregi TaxID=1816695 RepID=UPI0008F8A732|nr:S-layer homology domain-containing protein [Bacillus tuaregi]
MRLVVLLLFSMLAFFPTGAFADDFDAQTILEGDTEVVGFESASDMIWLKVDVDEDQGLLLDFTDVPRDLVYNVYLYDGNPYDGHILTYDYYFSGNQFLAYKVDHAGSYYVKMEPEEFASGEFDVTYTTTEPDQNEPNDVYTKAIVLDENETETLTLNAPNDVDWFKVQVEQDQGILLDFTGVPDDLVYNVTLFEEEALQGVEDPDDAEYLVSDYYFTGNQFWNHKVLKTGAYYIRIDVGDDNWYSEDYSTEPFNIKFTTSIGEGDQNDDYTQALELKTKETFTLNSPNDIDWFKIQVNQDQAMVLNVADVPNGMEYDFTLYDGKELEKAGDPERVQYLTTEYYLTGEQTLTHKVLKTGTYYIKINPSDESTYSTSFSTEVITLNLTTNTPDANEQNDSYKQATLLEGQDTMSLNAWNDIDWFKVAVEKEKQLKLGFSEVPAGVSFSVYVYKGSELEKFEDPERVEVIFREYYIDEDMDFTIDVPESGEYYILITSDNEIYETTVPWTTAWRIKDLNKAPMTNFTDVAAKYQDAVDFMVLKGNQGFSETLFGTYDNIKRVDAAIMLVRVLGLDIESAPDSGFTDVPGRAVKYINALKQAGITSGKTATTFDSQSSITRGELAIWIQRGFDLQANNKALAFTDVADRYKEAVEALVSNSITSGTSQTTFGTTDFAKRGDYAIFLLRSDMAMTK